MNQKKRKNSHEIICLGIFDLFYPFCPHFFNIFFISIQIAMLIVCVFLRTDKYPPQIVRPFQSKNVVDGAKVEFEAEIRGSPQPTIMWYRDEFLLPQTDDFVQSFQNGVARLVIPEVFPEDSGTIAVVATNELGKAACSAELVIECK